MIFGLRRSTELNLVIRRPLLLGKTIAIVEPRPVFRRLYGYAGLWRDCGGRGTSHPTARLAAAIFADQTNAVAVASRAVTPQLLTKRPQLLAKR